MKNYLNQGIIAYIVMGLAFVTSCKLQTLNNNVMSIKIPKESILLTKHQFSAERKQFDDYPIDPGEGYLYKLDNMLFEINYDTDTVSSDYLPKFKEGIDGMEKHLKTHNNYSSAIASINGNTVALETFHLNSVGYVSFTSINNEQRAGRCYGEFIYRTQDSVKANNVVNQILNSLTYKK